MIIVYVLLYEIWNFLETPLLVISTEMYGGDRVVQIITLHWLQKPKVSLKARNCEEILAPPLK